MSESVTPVAFFDFDGTLTKGDTMMPFLKFVVGLPKYYLKLIIVSPILVAYFLKLIRNDLAKQIVFKLYLSGYSIDELFKLGERFSEEIIPTMLRAEGMERLRWHQAQGHECILVSASIDAYLHYWSNSNGFESALTTSLETKKGLITGSIKGNNCHGEEKVSRVMAYMPQVKEGESYAYGDTSGELPLLSMSNHGFMYSKNKFKNIES